MSTARSKTDDRPSDQELERYMKTAAYRKRVKRMQRMVIERTRCGEKWTFDEIATGLKLPLDVVVGGFQHSIMKNFGDDLHPVGRLN
jgi:hypothetical protein